MRTGAIAAALTLALYGCGRTPAPTPDPHYVLGTSYQIDRVWHYPRENFDLDETGLAAIAKDGPPRLTTDGELFDQTAFAGAHPTIQLPSIAKVTNLENGRQITVRINDRGAGHPGRLVELTKRAALFLDIAPDHVARVRLQVLPNETHAAIDVLPNAPALAVQAAPRGGIEVAELAPPPGAKAGGGRVVQTAAVVSKTIAPTAAPPLRLPEVVYQAQPRPGRLIVRLDTFDEYHYAAQQQAKMAAVGAQIVYVAGGRHRQYRVDAGPFQDVAAADAALQRALSLGMPDARIVVD